MNITAVSYKPCWRENGKWYSTGGFPLQMNSIAKPYDSMYLLVPVNEKPKKGGISLDSNINVIPIPIPIGTGWIRKIYTLLIVPIYFYYFEKYMSKSHAIHTPLPGDLPLLAFLYGLLRGKKIIARYGNTWRTMKNTSLIQKLTKSLMKYAGKRNHIMLVTGVGSEPPSEGIDWIYSTALNSDIVSKTVANLSKKLSSSPKLVYIGRLSPEKGVHILIQAIGNLFSTRPEINLTLHIIGSGPQRKVLEQMVYINQINDRVIFHGQMNPQEMYSLLPEMDFCVQPSFSEGFSKAWLDAMLCGLPVLTTKVGAAEYIIGKDWERGWIIEPSNQKALEEKLLEILLKDDYNWFNLRSRCVSYIQDKTLENWADEIKTKCESKWEFFKIAHSENL